MQLRDHAHHQPPGDAPAQEPGGPAQRPQGLPRRGLVVGQALGGFIAQEWGLAAPFWFAFVGAGVTLALVWTRLARIAHADGGMGQAR